MVNGRKKLPRFTTRDRNLLDLKFTGCKLLETETGFEEVSC